MLNFSTTVVASKSVSQIQDALVEAGAQSVLHEYEQMCVSAVCFKISTPEGNLHYRISANVDGVLSALKDDSRTPKSKQTRQHAVNVAWRVWKDWVDVQLALIESKQVTLQQVCFPFALIANGETVWDVMKDKPMKAIGA